MRSGTSRLAESRARRGTTRLCGCRRRRLTHWRFDANWARGRKGDAQTRSGRRLDQYAAWLEALPENLQDSATAEALQAICDLDLTELQAIVPPRGFGRD